MPAHAAAVPFVEYMRRALYGPDGYYSHRARIGLAGADFFTASQSRLFAGAIGHWIESVWSDCGKPARLQVVELGAGQGELAERLLADLARSLPRVRVEYVIVETSPYLSALQRQRLQRSGANATVRWGGIAADVATVAIGNEVLDALPVERVRRQANAWERAWVAVSEQTGERVWEWRPAPPELAQLATRWLPVAVGYSAEICTDYAAVLQHLPTGAPTRMVLIDYGITSAEWQSGARPHGTLRGYRQHELVDPLSHPGRTDITADVHWDLVCATARNLGWDVHPLLTQGQFLLDNGVLSVYDQLRSLGTSTADILVNGKWAGELKTLIYPGGMGERFQVLQLAR